MNIINKEKELVWVQILYLFVIPTLLLYFKIIPGDFRIIMLLVITLLMLGIIKHNNWTFSDMEIFKKFMKDFFPYFIFTVAGVLFLIWLSAIITHSPFLNWWKNARFLLLFIPLSVAQEIVFRGILMKLLRHAFNNPIFIIGLNASVFALIHVIYVNATFVLPMTFIAGVGFAWMYYKYPNLILISISHTVLNFVGMLLGFFVLR
jgi:membrane protease YdiL (CAAX protease family)